MIKLTISVVFSSLIVIICRCDCEVLEEIRVIVIGSGPAGIAAASRLFENNFTQITILEAENRTGGRIQSIPFAGSVVDLGAEWCEGEGGNIVYELTKNLNLLEYDSGGNAKYYHSSGKNLDAGFVKKVQDLVYRIYREDVEENVTLGERMIKRFNETIKGWSLNPENLILSHEILGLFELEILSGEGAFSWYDVSAQNDEIPYESPRNLMWKGTGYKTILDVLTRKYPEPHRELPVYKSIQLNKEVIGVYWDGSPKVNCLDGTNYTADHVIWTPSLGVLKHTHRDVFHPGLPQGKVESIKTLGIAAVAKVFYHFPEKWWSDELGIFGFVWGEDDSRNLGRDYPPGLLKNGDSWLLSLRILTANPYRPNTLCAWICGEAVPEIEKLGDEAIIDGTMYLLGRFLGGRYPNITRPLGIIRENWYSNEHFRGTYSYDTLESRSGGLSRREVLGDPLLGEGGSPQVLFAGEATNPNHYGSVPGAIESGRREADRIVNYYKK